MRQKATAVLIAAAIAVSAPMTVLVVTGAPTSTSQLTQPVTVADAQVDTLELDNATIDNVTIAELEIDRLTVENQTGIDDIDQTLGAENGTVVLRNVSFEALSLENASAEGLGISAAGVVTNNPNGVDVGAVSNATIEQMSVDAVTIEQLDVDEREGGGIISGIVDFIRGLFGGGDDEGNETATPTETPADTGTPDGEETETPMDDEGIDDEETDEANTFLVVQNVSVDDLTIERMDVGTLATSEAPATETPTDTPAGTATETATPTDTPTGTPETPSDTGNLTIEVIENVTVENATIESIETERLAIETASPPSTPIFTPTDRQEPTPV